MQNPNSDIREVGFQELTELQKETDVSSRAGTDLERANRGIRRLSPSVKSGTATPEEQREYEDYMMTRYGPQDRYDQQTATTYKIWPTIPDNVYVPEGFPSEEEAKYEDQVRTLRLRSQQKIAVEGLPSEKAKMAQLIIRMNDAADIMRELEEEYPEGVVDEELFRAYMAGEEGNTLEQHFAGLLARKGLTQDQRAYITAAGDFNEAVLRPLSGAVISAGEISRNGHLIMKYKGLKESRQESVDRFRESATLGMITSMPLGWPMYEAEFNRFKGIHDYQGGYQIPGVVNPQRKTNQDANNNQEESALDKALQGRG